MRPKTDAKNQSHLVRRFAKYIDEQNACSACYAALICALRQHSDSFSRYSGSTIKIGQAFRNQKCVGFGVGNCCSGCDRHVPGCPPTATQILEMLHVHCQATIVEVPAALRLSAGWIFGYLVPVDTILSCAHFDTFSGFATNSAGHSTSFLRNCPTFSPVFPYFRQISGFRGQFCT